MQTREVNALTQYYIAQNAEQAPTTEGWLELAAGIMTADPEINDNEETFYYYDLDGGSEDVVGQVAQSVAFTGHRFHGDPAQDFVAKLEWAKGNERIVWFKQVDTDGTTFTGKGTLKAIKVRGGNAEDYKPFEVTIAWIGAPEITQATPIEEGTTGID